MTGDDAVRMAWFVGSLALVVSALAARRIKFGDGVKMTLAWVAIFGLVFLAIWAFQMARGG